jgi:hypothetical protein
MTGYYLRMVNAVYAMDDFPGDALLWRIEWDRRRVGLRQPSPEASLNVSPVVWLSRWAMRDRNVVVAAQARPIVGKTARRAS